jgi:RimJ/RimL family protein N-acetyltransferase
MPQQTLHTERITLVPLADGHLEWEAELDSDPEVMRYLSGRASTREEVESSHATRMAAAQKVDGLGFWVGLVDDEFVGWWILQPAHGPDQPDDRHVADLGYRVLRRHWRKGLASEGSRELMRYGFDDIGLDRIIAQTLTVNAASRAVMERVGLTFVRTFPTSVTAPAEGVERGGVVRNDARAVGALETVGAHPRIGPRPARVCGNVSWAASRGSTLEGP